MVLMDEGRIVSDCPGEQFIEQPLPLVRQFVAAASL